MLLTKEKKESIIKEFGGFEKNTGSSKVQIALLTARIKYITEHVKFHKKDHASKRGLYHLVSQRKKLLKYLKLNQPSNYTEILAKLNLKK